MAEDRREDALAVEPVERVGVGVADAGRLDLDQHLAGLRAFEVDLDDLERLLGFEGDGGAGLHFEAPFEEIADPPRDARVVVRRVERCKRGFGVVDPVVALFDQRLGVVDGKFGMELEGDGRPIGPRQGGEGREVGPGDDLGIRRLTDDLVLVRGGDRHFALVIQPWFGMNNIVALQTCAPALWGFDDVTAERFGHDLMAETDTDHLCVRSSADEVLERRNPWQWIVDARGRAGDEISAMAVQHSGKQPAWTSYVSSSKPGPNSRANMSG